MPPSAVSRRNRRTLIGLAAGDVVVRRRLSVPVHRVEASNFILVADTQADRLLQADDEDQAADERDNDGDNQSKGLHTDTDLGVLEGVLALGDPEEAASLVT